MPYKERTKTIAGIAMRDKRKKTPKRKEKAVLALSSFLQF